MRRPSAAGGALERKSAQTPFATPHRTHCFVCSAGWKLPRRSVDNRSVGAECVCVRDALCEPIQRWVFMKRRAPKVTDLGRTGDFMNCRQEWSTLMAPARLFSAETFWSEKEIKLVLVFSLHARKNWNEKVATVKHYFSWLYFVAIDLHSFLSLWINVEDFKCYPNTVLLKLIDHRK